MVRDICLSHSKEGRRSGEEEAAVNTRVTRHGGFTDSNVATPDKAVTILKVIRLDSIDFLSHLSAEMEGRVRRE
jgi:hypothetical protein